MSSLMSSLRPCDEAGEVSEATTRSLPEREGGERARGEGGERKGGERGLPERERVGRERTGRERAGRKRAGREKFARKREGAERAERERDRAGRKKFAGAGRLLEAIYHRSSRVLNEKSKRSNLRYGCEVSETTVVLPFHGKLPERLSEAALCKAAAIRPSGFPFIEKCIFIRDLNRAD